jgi:hypothetical protein
MTDLDLFHNIVRCTINVTSQQASGAVAKIRALIAANPPAVEPEREEKSSPNRREKGGITRSAE